MPSGRLVPVTGRWGPAVRAELEATDWERTPIVDVVTYAPASGRHLEGDQQRTEVYRYADAPPLDLYENEERSFRIERVTRPLYERL